jgi:hypothetical protein
MIQPFISNELAGRVDEPFSGMAASPDNEEKTGAQINI